MPPLWPLVVALPLAAYGCGDTDERTSNLRPPAPINVSVEIGDDGVSASPSKFGAGPIVADREQPVDRVSHPHDRRTAGEAVGRPDQPAGHRHAQGDGRHRRAHALDDGSRRRPARLNVGPKRPSAQNKLQQP